MVVTCLFIIIAAHKDVDLHIGYTPDLYFKVILFPVMVIIQTNFYKLRNTLASEEKAGRQSWKGRVQITPCDWYVSPVPIFS